MILTREWLHANISGLGSINRRQTEILGIPWPPPKGWLTAMVGKEVDDSILEKFVAAKKKKGRNPIADCYKGNTLFGRNSGPSQNLVEGHRARKFSKLAQGPPGAKYVVVGGFCHVGGQFQRMEPEEVAERYGLNPEDCIMVKEWTDIPPVVPKGSQIVQIRFDGKWEL